MNKEILVSFLILDSNKQFSLAVQYDFSLTQLLRQKETYAKLTLLISHGCFLLVPNCFPGSCFRVRVMPYNDLVVIKENLNSTITLSILYSSTSSKLLLESSAIDLARYS